MSIFFEINFLKNSYILLLIFSTRYDIIITCEILLNLYQSQFFKEEN